MTEKIGYKLNPKKLQKAPQGILPYVCGAFYYTEDYEYFYVIKPYLDIPEQPKTLDEIQQEFDEKIDKLIEQTKRNFYAYKLTAERKYEDKFDRIFDNFEYAKEHGQFPLKYTIGTLSGSYLVSSGSGDLNWTAPNFVVKQGSNHKGYYTIGNQRYFRYYMLNKPNFVSRFFMDKLLGFKWIDEKDT